MKDIDINEMIVTPENVEIKRQEMEIGIQFIIDKEKDYFDEKLN